MAMRILITGGFGFVGGRIAKHLHESGHDVVLGTRQDVKIPEWLPEAKAVQTYWQDTSDLERVCQGVDVVIHAAGMNAQDCAADPVAALDFNGVATARLVASAIKANVKQFIYLSTAHIYASPLAGIITEETCPRNLHPYATSHLAGEFAVRYASQKGEIKGQVLRLSNAFGAPMHKEANCWTLLFNDLCRQAVTTRRLVLLSSGIQQRDFVTIEQVCRVMNWLLRRDYRTLSATIFNVGSGASQTVFEVAQSIQARCKEVLGFEPELNRPAVVGNEFHKPLCFKCENLKKTGFYISQTSVAEIDRSLIFCAKNFVE